MVREEMSVADDDDDDDDDNVDLSYVVHRECCLRSVGVGPESLTAAPQTTTTTQGLMMVIPSEIVHHDDT